VSEKPKNTGFEDLVARTY